MVNERTKNMLSQVTDWIFSQEGMTLVLGLIGAVYTLLKKKEIDGTKIEWNRKIAGEALQVGVLGAFQQYVKGMKEQDPNGKVQPEVETKAHTMATAIAENAAATQGVDLKKAVGADFIDYNIKKIVADLKAKGIIPSSAEIKK
jgi:hypothetical protein